MPATMYEERAYSPDAAALEVDVAPGPQPGTVSVCVRGEVTSTTPPPCAQPSWLPSSPTAAASWST